MMQAHQATAVAIGGRALLIEGPPGAGKSSLALALIDRGAVLIGDDGVMLEVEPKCMEFGPNSPSPAGRGWGGGARPTGHASRLASNTPTQPPPQGGGDKSGRDTAGNILLARPHPNTRGLLEVRGLGLLSYAVCEAAPVALVLRLDSDAPRYVEAAEWVERAEVMLPMLRLLPEGAALHLRAELALARFGLDLPAA